MSTLKGGGMLLTLTGPSAVGKSTTMKRLMEADPRIKLLTSTTTRKANERDLEGEYEYITEPLFLLMKREHLLLWTAEIHGHRYGTRARLVASALDPNIFAIAALVPNAVEQLHAFASQLHLADQVRSIYFCSPGPEVLRKRLQERNASPEYAARRLRDCKSWDLESFQSQLYSFRIPGHADLDTKQALAYGELFRTH